MLYDSGVRFIGSTTVTAVEDGEVTLDTGAAVEAELVVSATGVRPDSRLATAAGLDTENGRIVVDERMHTSAVSSRRRRRRTRLQRHGGTTDPVRTLARRLEQGRIAGFGAAGYTAAWTDVRILLRHRALRIDIPRLGHRL